MRHIPQPISFEDARRLLAYDPATGELTWRESNRRTKAGDLAGSLTKDGYVSVTVKNTKIRGQYLAWLLHYGEWPRCPVRMKAAIDIDATDDKQLFARQDLRIDNLVLADTVMSQTPAAQRSRHYHNTRRRHHETYSRYLAGQEQSSYPNVTFDPAISRWVTLELFSLQQERSALYGDMASKARVLSDHASRHDAERAAADMLANRHFLTDSVTGLETPKPLPPGVGDATAGPLGPTLTDLHTKLAYAPNDGLLIWRTGAKRYQNAAIPTTGRTSYVPYLTWRLPAHSVAFFLAKGIWPSRGTIWPFDGDWRNIKLMNLIYAHHVITAYPLEQDA